MATKAPARRDEQDVHAERIALSVHLAQQKELIASMNPMDVLQRVRKDDLFFMENFVYTLDTVDKKNPIKQFPAHKEHIRATVDVWNNNVLIAEVKSRRMIATWTYVTLFLRDTMCNIGRENFFISRKESIANNLLKRAFFIYNHIPEPLKSMLPKCYYKKNELSFPEIDSRIFAVQQGEHQMRDPTSAGVFCDEMAFWEWAEETFTALKPCIEGGGRLVCLSTPAIGFFQRLVMDKIDDHDGHAQRSIKSIMQGMRVGVNPGNGFTVVEIHYTADPEKRTQEWKAEAHKGIPVARWEREYELKWDVPAGAAVHPDFKTNLHVHDHNVIPTAGLPIVRGWDFGRTPSCIMLQQVGPHVNVIDEIYEFDTGVDRFSQMVGEYCGVHYPGFQFVDYGDPSGWSPNEVDERTTRETVERNLGITMQKGLAGIEERLIAVDAFLCRIIDGRPKMMFNPSCEWTIDAIDGGYHFSERGRITRQRKKRVPVKDDFSHIMDALQYALSKMHNVVPLRRRPTRGIGRPGYAFDSRKRNKVVSGMWGRTPAS